jgi:hypothetical protein
VKLLAKLLTLLALALGVGVGSDVTPVSAYLSNCSVGWYGTNDGHSKCTSSRFGGFNRQRVKIVCWQSSGGGSTETKYGSYVNVNTISAAWCDSSHPWAGVVSYQLI